MKNLIIPMAGKSSRFPDMRPKWMLTHPMTNRFMGIESILGFNLEFFDNIYYVCLSDHEKQYNFLNGFLLELEELGLKDKVKILFLEGQTRSQSETVYNAIQIGGIEGFIFIKDSDGYYECNIKDEKNQVAFFNLNDMDDINARTKSYIEFDINGLITNIVEKKVISSTFSVGGYGFQNAKEFCKTYQIFKNTEEECYISNIIFEMILSGYCFYGLKIKNFKDWGTVDAWNKYKSQYRCLFIDIDGTLVSNSSVHFPPYIGTGDPLNTNISFLRSLYNSGKAKIILTTSRPERLRELTISEMIKYNMPYDTLIMNLPHCKRVVINDFAKSNPYPSCEAINLPRNFDNLAEFLK
ncbi:conserved hypothetical protein [Gammaproteobacteria bacterium]